MLRGRTIGYKDDAHHQRLSKQGSFVAADGIATKRLNRRQASFTFLWGSPRIASSLSMSIMTSSMNSQSTSDYSYPKVGLVKYLPSSPRLYLVIFGYQCQK